MEFDTRGGQRRHSRVRQEVHGRETKIRGKQRGTEASEARGEGGAEDGGRRWPKTAGVLHAVMGNLNPAIHYYFIHNFFKDNAGGDVRGEMAHNKDTGSSGRGVADFATDEDLDKAAALNGKTDGSPI